MTVPEKMHCGLKTRHGGEIPLKGVRVDARLSGPCSEVTVTHRYENQEKTDVEAVYVFPLEEGSAVSGFRARVGDRIIEGCVEEKERAFEIYDDAMADGHGAFLLDQERPNIFTASVGNLKAGQSAEVSVTYVALLNQEGKAARFSLPTTVAPRYVPDGPPEVGEPDGERVNPKAWFEVPYGLTLNIDIAAGSPIRSIESPSHAIRTELDGDRAKVTLAVREDALDRDFVLLVEPKESNKPLARVAREEDGTRVVMVTFVPAEDELEKAGPCEIDFVLDCSGSMQGSSIDEAKRALELCVRAMSEGDTFNVIPFGSTFQSLWDEPRPYNQSNLDEAVAFIRRCDANMGGTEILRPMQYVLDQHVDSTRPRQLLLLTDGEVSNEAAVITLCREKASSARVFAFGIGHGASEHLVRGVARASRGAAEFIYPGERIEAKVLRMFSRVRTPALTDVKMDWGGLEVEQAPKRVPPVFGGDALTLFGRVASGTAEKLVLRAGDNQWTVAVDPEKAESDGPIPTLWARHRIRDLEAGKGGARGSNQGRGKGEDRVVSQIVELGKRYGLMSKHTSYVAVEERADADKTTEQAELRRIPIALTKGWGGAGRTMALSAGPPMAGAAFHASAGPPPAPMPASMPLRQARRKRGGFADKVGGLFKGRTKSAQPEMEYAAAEEGAPYLDTQTLSGAVTVGADPLYDLLLTQRADGSFLLTPALEGWLGNRAKRVRKEADKLGEALVATAVVVALLAAEMADREAEWKMAAGKAKKWLDKQADGVDGAALI